MGWTYGPNPIEGWKPYLDGNLTWETETHINRVLDSAIVHRKEYYAAVERITKETGAREVWCAVFLLNFVPSDSYGFGYKDMTESMGPYVCQCPRRILDLLTPTDNETANEWRERCRKRIARRKQISAMQVGDRFTYQDSAYTLKSKRPWRAMDEHGFTYLFHQSAKEAIKLP